MRLENVPLFAFLTLIPVTLACSLTANLPFLAEAVQTTAAVEEPSIQITPVEIETAAAPTALQSEAVVSQLAGVVRSDVTYCTIDGVALKMDLYFPEEMQERTPVILNVHGGGWRKGDKSGGVSMYFARGMVSSGYIVASIDYRLAPEFKFPAQIIDVKCAVRYLRAHADEYALDADHIGAIGSSAGGHLAALLGTADEGAGWDDTGDYPEQSSRVQAVVDLFGPTDLTILFPGANTRIGEEVFGNRDKSAAVFSEASPVTHVSPDDPPFLILHGEKDELVPPAQSEELYQRLQEAGVPVELILVENAAHGFKPVDSKIFPSKEVLMQSVSEFFNLYLH